MVLAHFLAMCTNSNHRGATESSTMGGHSFESMHIRNGLLIGYLLHSMYDVE